MTWVQWAPILAALLTSLVNVLLALNLRVRQGDSARDDAEIRRIDEHIARVENEVSVQRARMHELADRKFSEVITRLAVIDAELKRVIADIKELRKADE